jgi:hypothetical protein
MTTQIAALRGDRLWRSAMRTPMEAVVIIPSPIRDAITLNAIERSVLGFDPGSVELLCGFESSFRTEFIDDGASFFGRSFSRNTCHAPDSEK